MSKRRNSGSAFSLFSFQDIITSVTGIMILITLILALELLDRVEASPANGNAQEYEQIVEVIAELEEEIQRLEQQLEAATSRLENLPSLDIAEIERQTEAVEDDIRRLGGEIDRAADNLTEKRKKLNQSESEFDRTKVENAKQLERLREEAKRLEARLRKIEDGNRIIYQQGSTGKRTWLVEVTKLSLRVAPIGSDTKPRSFRDQSGLADFAETLNRSTDMFLLVVKPDGSSRFDGIKLRLGKEGLGFDVGYHLAGQDQVVLDPQTGAGGI